MKTTPLIHGHGYRVESATRGVELKTIQLKLVKFMLALVITVGALMEIRDLPTATQSSLTLDCPLSRVQRQDTRGASYSVTQQRCSWIPQ